MLTLRYLNYWHTRYNNLVFDGKLKRANIKIKVIAEGGWCIDHQPVEIWIKKGSKLADARAYLLHEMVHQWQLEYEQPFGHGHSFQMWDPICQSRTGSPL